jgi:hypothetical protein
MKINAKLYRTSDYPTYYKNLEFIFDKGIIRCNESDNLDSMYYIGRLDWGNKLVVNSDYITKVGGLETDYTLNSGANGWVLYYDKNTDVPVICYSNVANKSFSHSNGDTMVSNFYNIPLVNYIGKLFNEAENGGIVAGTIVADSEASGGYTVQGTGDVLNFAIFDTRSITSGKEVPIGQYKVIFRVKANTTSVNDSIGIYIWGINSDGTLGTKYTSQIIYASDIGTSYNYFILDWDYSDANTYGYKIGVGGNTNVDGTLFNVDYAMIVPVSEIENLQKRVFVNNNQKLSVIPK